MKIKKSDVIWTYVAKFFILGVNIILLPLIMAYLTDTELGLWYVFASISQVVNLFDFGFNATISRHMTYAWSGAKELEKNSVGNYEVLEEKNVNLISEVVSTCKIVYLVISIAALFGMVTLGTLYIYQIVDKNITKNIIISWFIYVFAVFLNLLYGYWSSLLLGIGAVSERNKMSIYSKVVQIILAFLLLYNGWGLLGFVISYAISGIALRIIGKLYFEQKTAELNLDSRMRIRDIKKCFGTIWATAWKDGVVMLSQYLSTQANTLVSAYFIDLSATSVYGIITQIGSIIGSLSAAYYAAYQPQYSSLCLKKDKQGLRILTCKSVFVYQLIFVIMTLGFVVVGIPLLMWIRPTMEINIVMVLSVCLFYYLYNQHSLFCSMIASINRILYYKCYIVTAVCAIVISVITTAIFDTGIWGLIWSQIIANAVYNNWYWPRLVMKEQDIKYLDIYTIGYRNLKKELKG